MSLKNSSMNVFDTDLSIQALNCKAQEQSDSWINHESQANEKVDNQTLIKFHKIHGNKWKQISNHLQKTSDSFIKNMFYTLARKALRKVNVFIELDSKIKIKKAKLFKLNFVFKLANLAESQRISDSKQNFDNLKGFYTKLLYNLLQMGNIDSEHLKRIVNLDNCFENEQNMKKNFNNLIENLRIIEKIFIEQNLIKKGRTKKKFPKKGLVQKAYSSKAFKETFDESETQSLLSLSTSHSKQHKINSIQIQDTEGLDLVCQLEVFPQNYQRNRDDLDNCLEIKTFDPILFE